MASAILVELNIRLTVLVVETARLERRGIQVYYDTATIMAVKTLEPTRVEPLQNSTKIPCPFPENIRLGCMWMVVAGIQVYYDTETIMT